MTASACSSFFCRSYAEARGRFIAAVGAVGWIHESHVICAAGPAGEALTLDVAISPSPARRTLVISGGLHGVEGYLGTAVQLALLEKIAAGRMSVPPDCRVVLLHALNPYGYAHDRRVNEDGVDLNRNFLLPGEVYAGSPEAYPMLDPLLNPRGKSSGLFIPRLLWHGCTKGFRQVREAIVCGQYDFPHGLFYGGSASCETVRIVERELPFWLPSDTETAVWIDVHTGLGKSGEATLLTETSLPKIIAHPLSKGLLSERISSMSSSQVAYPARGTLTGWLVRQAFTFPFLAWGLEIGTHPSLPVLSALRAENAHPGAQEKARLREMFCPSSQVWRQRVIPHALSVFERSLSALAGFRGDEAQSSPGNVMTAL